jgi:hypothetical protein
MRDKTIFGYTLAAVQLILLNGDASGYIKALKKNEQKAVRNNLQKIVDSIVQSADQ